MFTNKYQLTTKENEFLLKKTLVQSVYSTAKVENINVTFPQTKTIMDGMSVKDIDLDDLQKVLNLRNAWKFVVSTLHEPFNLDYICKIHSFVAYNEALEWGKLRTGRVGIYGVDYVPPIPVESEVREYVTELFNSSNSITDLAIKYMLYAKRSQLFWDGNKRTAIISANKLLASYGNGVLIIPTELLEEYNSRLTDFYQTNDYSKIDKFLYDKCIFGIDYD